MDTAQQTSETLRTHSDDSIRHGDTVRASWNFSLDRIRQDTEHFERDEQETMVALFLWCIDDRHPMRKEDAARRIGCSDNLLYQLYTGKYREPQTREPKRPSDDLIKKINSFLSLERERYELGQTEFVLTPTAKKIFSTCDLARESQSPAILWGPSHIGKTWALRQYQQKNNHGRTFMCELEAASGLGGMVRKIADACGISDRSNTSSLIDRIKKALTPNSLLILDEVHLLKHTYRLNSFFACIEVIRRIYDKAQCGMVLSWTNIDDLKNASQGELTQLWRRGVHKRALPLMPTKDDITAILQRIELSFPSRELRITVPTKKEPIIESPYEILRQLAKNQGLKSITERIRYARRLAGKANAKVSWTSFVDAHLRIEKQSVPEPEWD